MSVRYLAGWVAGATGFVLLNKVQHTGWPPPTSLHFWAGELGAGLVGGVVLGWLFWLSKRR